MKKVYAERPEQGSSDQVLTNVFNTISEWVGGTELSTEETTEYLTTHSVQPAAAEQRSDSIFIRTLKLLVQSDPLSLPNTAEGARFTFWRS